MAKKTVTIKVSQCTCEKCGFEWTAKSLDPKMCPKCKTVLWDVKRNEEK
jgi:predicted Zn-ribbon and HTH transcriptional regulator